MARPERFLVTLEAPPGGAPAAVRLRRFLKAALRSFGLRCVRVAPAGEGPEALTGGAGAVPGGPEGPEDGPPRAS
jgi:hypothetical protein